MADLGFSIAELEAFLGGEDTSPKPEPARRLPGTLEMDERPTFVDVLRAAHSGNAVRQKPVTNSFVGFLARVYRDKTQRLKSALDNV